MKKYFILSIIAFLPLVNCTEHITPKTGKIKLAFNFPAVNNFSIKKIPDGTNAFLVHISGNLMSETVTKVTSEQKVKYFDVPIGNKRVKVDAVDTNDTILATGSANVDVHPYMNSSVTIVLTEVTGSSLPTPAPTLTPSPVPSGPVIPTSPTPIPQVDNNQSPTPTPVPFEYFPGSDNEPDGPSVPVEVIIEPDTPETQENGQND